jgi:rubrerythrin
MATPTPDPRTGAAASGMNDPGSSASDFGSRATTPSVAPSYGQGHGPSAFGPAAGYGGPPRSWGTTAFQERRGQGRRRNPALPMLLGVGAVAALAFGVQAARRNRGAAARFRSHEAALVAELNDLLQLDHDAVQAYGVAISRLEDAELRRTLERFRGDHERHVAELSSAIRSLGGRPIELSHIPTGLFKLAVQQVGAVGGDRGVLLAFKSNEGQARDKYLRHAQRQHMPWIGEMLRRNAQDEVVHYEWAVTALERLGVAPDSMTSKVQQGFETVHGKTADVVEAGERAAMGAVEKMKGPKE